MPEAPQTVGKQVSFSKLFEEFQVVQIPIIQRDYAQGREEQEELRQELLSALKQAIDREETDPSVPLDMDFVYGSAFGDDGSNAGENFAPLDGQQRLTTLFLLHWYLAWKDGEMDDFDQRFVREHRSRLSYEVRPSSHDFFDALATSFPGETLSEIDSLSALLQDKSWFFHSWKHDPTIRSTLTMLDEIHELFGGSDGFYQRLVDEQHPRITFQLLELKHFGLSDDLYIKMNARGKPLTAFETFKARLEQHLDELLPGETRNLNGSKVSVRKYFSERMDTAWADLFWAHRNPTTNLYDEQLMRLIKAVALASLNPEDENAENTLGDLRSLRSSVSFSRFLSTDSLNPTMLITLERVLDYWSAISDDDWNDEDAPTFNSRVAFDSVTGRDLVPYPDLTKFAAFCMFVRSHKLPLKLEGLNRWLRVIFNLVENSDIERPSDFINVLRSLNQLEKHADTILDYLTAGSEVDAFNRQQVREERIKAALIMKSPTWEERIFAAERHNYFKGQIEFLLKFCGVFDQWLAQEAIVWADKEDKKAQKTFSNYLEKAEAVFDGNGLRRFEGYEFERALLTLGDYTLPHSKNHSFLQNRVGSGERRPTWKLLLRGSMSDSDHEKKRLLVKQLFDRLDLAVGVEASLEEVVKARSVIDPWREMVVDSPDMIAYCDQKMFRHLNDGRVFLISKLRTSSDHAELWSYYLYKTLLEQLEEAGTLSPFTTITYS